MRLIERSNSMPRTILRCILPAALCLTLLSTTLSAQQRADPIAIGQGKSSVATARGISSLYSNVGSLGLDEMGRRGESSGVQIDATLLPIGVAAGSTYLSASDLNFVFDSKDCSVFTDEDRLRLSKVISGDKLSADVAFDLVAARIRLVGIGAFAFRFGHQVRARMSFPENFHTTVLGTDDIFAQDYAFDDADVGGEWIRSIGMAFGSSWRRPNVDEGADCWLPEIGFGLSVDRLEGIAHFNVDPESAVRTRVLSNGEVYSNRRAISVEGQYTFRSSAPQQFEPAQAIVRPGFSDADSNLGSGWGGSLGVSVVVLRTVDYVHEVENGTPLEPQHIVRNEMVTRDAIVFGMSVDEIGSILWDGFNLQRQRVIDSVMFDDGGGLTYEMLCEYTGELDTIGAFRTQLPTQFRIGAGVDVTAFVREIPGDLIMSAEGGVDVVDGAIGGQRHPRVSLGGSWRPVQWFVLRAGAQFGGLVGGGFSLGAGLQPLPWLSIDAASSELNSLFQSDPDRYDIALRIATHLQF
jgi:hypothetical protein